VRLTQTIKLTRRRLPHWEVDRGRYFVTVRCADSLPAEIVIRLTEAHRAMTKIPARSAGFIAARREAFRFLEKHRDAGFGSCPLSDSEAAVVVIDELQKLSDWEIAVPHYSIMPNHWHAVLVPSDAKAHSLSTVMKRLKGRTTRRIRRFLPGKGPFWQGEWFDRWIRDEPEWNRIVTYIHNNPVKAGLALKWQLHGLTK